MDDFDSPLPPFLSLTGNGVEFNVERGPKGPRAINVRMIKA